MSHLLDRHAASRERKNMNKDSTSAFAPYVDGANVIHIGTAPRIAVEYIGEGPLVLMLHGIGGDRSTWAHQLITLGKDRVLCSGMGRPRLR